MAHCAAIVNLLRAFGRVTSSAFLGLDYFWEQYDGNGAYRYLSGGE